MRRAVNIMYVSLFVFVFMFISGCRTTKTETSMEKKVEQNTDSLTIDTESYEEKWNAIREQIEDVVEDTEAFYEKISYYPPDSTGRQAISQTEKAQIRQTSSSNSRTFDTLFYEASDIRHRLTSLNNKINTYQEEQMKEWRYARIIYQTIIAVLVAAIIIYFVVRYYNKRKP